MEGWEIIQQCELAPGLGAYGKRKFLSAVSDLTTEEFNRFCRTYLHLVEFHSQNQNVWVTDNRRLVNKHYTSFWRLSRVDFDTPITFRRVK